MVETLMPIARSAWWWVLGGCIAIRLAFPVAALVAEGSTFPGLPRFDYGQLYGDANAYYAASREIIAASAHVAPLLVGLALLGVGGAYLALRRRAGLAVPTLILATAVAAAATLVVIEMRPAGAPAVGWPLIWAVALAPLRVVDPGFGPEAAIGFGLALSFLALATTVVSTAYIGLYASGKRTVGLLAAVLFAAWPLVPGLVVGERAWENGTWLVDVGLALYTEPFSTALVVGAVALLLRPRTSDLVLVVAGLSLGFATVTKLTNGPIVLGLILVVAWSRGRRAAALLTGASLVFAPVVVGLWAKGLASTYDGALSASNNVWSLGYVRRSWGESLLFTPTLLVLIVPLAAIGAALLSGRARATLLVPIGLTVITYSCYQWTPIHPRFFYVVLPLVLVLDAAVILALCVWVGQAFGAFRSRSVSKQGGREPGG